MESNSRGERQQQEQIYTGVQANLHWKSQTPGENEHCQRVRALRECYDRIRRFPQPLCVDDK